MDSWHVLIAMLVGAWPVPVLTWPADRTRIVVAAPDTEPDLDLPPEPPAPAPLTAADAAILEHLADAGPASVRAVAAAACIPRQTAWRGLQRLQGRGLVVLADKGWHVRPLR